MKGVTGRRESESESQCNPSAGAAAAAALGRRAGRRPGSVSGGSGLTRQGPSRTSPGPGQAEKGHAGGFSCKQVLDLPA